jgi:hypothetical protein
MRLAFGSARPALYALAYLDIDDRGTDALGGFNHGLGVGVEQGGVVEVRVNCLL